jgi:hypothetical protein
MGSFVSVIDDAAGDFSILGNAQQTEVSRQLERQTLNMSSQIQVERQNHNEK